MPELPEVELMASYLSARVLGTQIERVEVLRGKYLPDQEANDLVGRKIEGIVRRGKYLCFFLDRGILVGHNAMSGFWDMSDDPWTFDYVEGKRTASERDVRVKIFIRQVTSLGMGPLRELRFHDSRLFGSLHFYGVPLLRQLTFLEKMGPEAIHTRYGSSGTRHGIGWSWSVKDLAESARNIRREIKDILMDQRQVAGIGNIYATEGLWRAGVNPWCPARDLSIDTLTDVWIGVTETMKESVFLNVDYKNFLRCYRQKECKRCKTKIEKGELRGRGTYYCPLCQAPAPAAAPPTTSHLVTGSAPRP